MGLVYPYVFRFLDGVDFLFGKIAMGWLGGWLGSPVLGHWFWKIEDAYVVPSILGAGAAIHLSVLWWKAAAKAFQVRSTGRGGLVA